MLSKITSFCGKLSWRRREVIRVLGKLRFYGTSASITILADGENAQDDRRSIRSAKLAVKPFVRDGAATAKQ
jgi:hypothetical protein